MTDEPIPGGQSHWLWILVFISMAALILIWLINTWTVESEVKQGASADGLTFPANPGHEVRAPTGDQAAETAPAAAGE